MSLSITRPTTNQSVRDYLTDWFRNNPTSKVVAVSLTMKHYIKYRAPMGGWTTRKLDIDAAEENLRHFGNFIDGKLGLGSRRNRTKLKRAFVFEFDKDNHPHIHGFIAIPHNSNFARAKEVLEECWKKTTWGWEQEDFKSSYVPKGNVLPQRIDEGWVRYLTKEENADEEHNEDRFLFSATSLVL